MFALCEPSTHKCQAGAFHQWGLMVNTVLGVTFIDKFSKSADVSHVTLYYIGREVNPGDFASSGERCSLITDVHVCLSVCPCIYRHYRACISH